MRRRATPWWAVGLVLAAVLVLLPSLGHAQRRGPSKSKVGNRTSATAKSKHKGTIRKRSALPRHRRKAGLRGPTLSNSLRRRKLGTSGNKLVSTKRKTTPRSRTIETHKAGTGTQIQSSRPGGKASVFAAARLEGSVRRLSRPTEPGAKKLTRADRRAAKKQARAQRKEAKRQARIAKRQAKAAKRVAKKKARIARRAVNKASKKPGRVGRFVEGSLNNIGTVGLLADGAKFVHRAATFAPKLGRAVSWLGPVAMGIGSTVGLVRAKTVAGRLDHGHGLLWAAQGGAGAVGSTFGLATTGVQIGTGLAGGGIQVGVGLYRVYSGIKTRNWSRVTSGAIDMVAGSAWALTAVSAAMPVSMGVFIGATAVKMIYENRKAIARGAKKLGQGMRRFGQRTLAGLGLAGPPASPRGPALVQQ